MKKLLFFALLLLATRSTHAQFANATITNCTDYDIQVTLYGWAQTTCPVTPSGCSGTYMTSVINIPWGTTWGPFTPCGVSTGVGWAVDACGPTPWCSSLPPDFEWTLAEINIPLAGGWGAFPIFIGPQLGASGYCSPATSTVGPTYSITTPGPTVWYMDFNWMGGGPLGDVSIQVCQHK